MLIQQVTITPDITLYITGFNQETGEMIYRLSTMVKMINKDIIAVDGNNQVKVPGYHFDAGFLGKFIQENPLISGPLEV